MNTVPDWIAWDEASDTITIDGIVFARELFRHFASAHIGAVGRIRRRSDGVITIETIAPDVVRSVEAAIAKRSRRIRRAA